LLLRRKKWQSTAFLVMALFAGISGLSGCGSNGSLGTPPGNYKVTVIGTSISGGTTISHAITAQLKVT
jgi:predicted small lipoprotein YifL